MIGTFLNVGGILVGGIAGLTVARNLSPRAQQRLRLVLVLLTIYTGFSLIWQGLKPPFGHAAGQLGIALLALLLGSLLGNLLRLQRGLNRAGQWARERFSRATQAAQAGLKPDAARRSDGFITCTLLFCVGPMAIIGSVQDGLNGDWRTLAVKGLLDGLATMGFVTTFGWSPLLAALPVLAYQGLLTVGAHALAPLVEQTALRDSIGVTGGFIIATISLVILDLRKVPLANYLPALVLAPLLTHWWL
jgi:uncharacterized membrane protein YqgA involved in biofilm formation